MTKLRQAALLRSADAMAAHDTVRINPKYEVGFENSFDAPAVEIPVQSK